jgi:transmembrane sensor
MNDDLLIKFLLKETIPEEDVQVREWTAASVENQKEFERFELIWNSSKKLELESSADPNQAWEKFKIKVSEPKVGPLKPITQRYGWLKVAAVLFIVTGAWSFYSLFNSGYNTIEAGELVRVETLPDGSEVTLNRNTKLAYQKNFKGKSRNVKLESGEVFFNVTPDKSKPFIIEADDITVRVVGTSFNVKHINNNTEVIVETGIVQVSMNNQMVELRRGEKVSIKGKNAGLQKQANTDQLYNYYRSKLFVADNTPLWRVVEILNEAYDTNIVIESEQIKNLPLSTTFKDESLENIIHVITETFKISAVKEDGRIILK